MKCNGAKAQVRGRGGSESCRCCCVEEGEKNKIERQIVCV